MKSFIFFIPFFLNYLGFCSNIESEDNHFVKIYNGCHNFEALIFLNHRYFIFDKMWLIHDPDCPECEKKEKIRMQQNVIYSQTFGMFPSIQDCHTHKSEESNFQQQ